MDIPHRLRKRLKQLNHVRPPSFQRSFDFLVEPGVYMDLTELELLHYVLERGHTGGNVFGLVGERFEEAGCVFLAVEANNERFEGKCCYSVLRRYLLYNMKVGVRRTSLRVRL
jgi:hypothetical protein